MRFSEYVKRSNSRRSLYENELNDNSYYVDTNGFVTTDSAKDIELSDDGQKLYDSIINSKDVKAVEKALDNDIKKFGSLHNGGIDAFVKVIYPWAKLKYDTSDIQAVSIILANDWYESRKAKLNLKENCKRKSLKESETYDLEFLKDVLAQCSDAQLADIYNMIVVENLNNCSLSSIANPLIVDDNQICEPFASLFYKNGIDLDAVYIRYSTILGKELPSIDYEKYDEYFGDESIESVLKDNLGTHYDISTHGYGYDSVFVELEDIAIKNVWQKASGIDNLEFATRLLENLVEDDGIEVIQNYIEESYRLKSADDVTPDVIKNAIIAVILRDLGNYAYLLSGLVTFTPKALDALKKFSKGIDEFCEDMC